MYEGYIPKGTYTLEITSENYLTVSKEVVLYQSTLAIHEPLKRKPLPCEIKVVDLTTGKGIADATISIEEIGLNGETEQDGTYQCELDPERFQVVVEREGFLQQVAVFEVEINEQCITMDLIPTENSMVLVRCYPNTDAKIAVINEHNERLEAGDPQKIAVYNAFNRLGTGLVTFGPSSSWGRVV